MNIQAFRINWRTCDLWGFLAVIVMANLTLLFGKVCSSLIFLPAPAFSGEWWRWLTFPFVHVSWYHLLMDAGAFLFLYHSLQETSQCKRLLLVATCAAGSLGAALLTSSLSGGLCGLSGIAHGLMAIFALEFMRSENKSVRHTGIICFWIVVLKSIMEALSGHVLFEALHFGQVASPVAVSHAGGVLGGLFSMTLFDALARLVNP
ncbi:MAG: rhombosortase [Kiritimatiellales bacterium]